MYFSNETQTLNFFCYVLNITGWKNIQTTQPFDKYCQFDIFATAKDGRIFEFELKNRSTISHTKYGDNFTEKIKTDKILDDLKYGRCDKAFLISFFNDYYVASDISRECKYEYRMCPETTIFGKRNYINKLCSIYKQDILLRYE